MSQDILDQAGRVSLVTGAGQGVGRQIALHLSGHNSGGVAVNDYVLERAESVADEIKAAGGKAIAVQADVTDTESVKAMVARINDELGPVGTLINNAGNMGANPTADTIISDAARHGDAGFEAYSAAKAGAAGFMRSLARSTARFQVTANCIAISATRTPAIAAQLANEALMKKVLSNYIVRRPGEPEDVANMALFLASEASSWISGHTYPVDGGFVPSL